MVLKSSYRLISAISLAMAASAWAVDAASGSEAAWSWRDCAVERRRREGTKEAVRAWDGRVGREREREAEGLFIACRGEEWFRATWRVEMSRM